jgi:hypothetical protein
MFGQTARPSSNAIASPNEILPKPQERECKPGLLLGILRKQNGLRKISEDYFLFWIFIFVSDLYFSATGGSGS